MHQSLGLDGVSMILGQGPFVGFARLIEASKGEQLDQVGEDCKTRRAMLLQGKSLVLCGESDICKS